VRIGAPTAFTLERRPAPVPRRPPLDIEDLVTGIWYVVGYAFAGISFVFLTIGLAWLISHRTRGDKHKGYPYESGIDTFGDTHARFGISFYIYAIMFVAFDIEVIFIFLWALIFQGTDVAAIGGLFLTMLIFVSILLFGLAYAWRKGVLTWR
jgi:NADH:ubiquinone oxidoreductase subunit 3 (subunit A)